MFLIALKSGSVLDKKIKKEWNAWRTQEDIDFDTRHNEDFWVCWNNSIYQIASMPYYNYTNTAVGPTISVVGILVLEVSMMDEALPSLYYDRYYIKCNKDEALWPLNLDRYYINCNKDETLLPQYYERYYIKCSNDEALLPLYSERYYIKCNMDETLWHRYYIKCNMDEALWPLNYDRYHIKCKKDEATTVLWQILYKM